jgi:hypothetical protein
LNFFFENVKLREGIMLRTVPLTTTKERELKTMMSLSGKFAFFGIVPPREQKRLKWSKKRVKLLENMWIGVYSIGGSLFWLSGYRSSMRETAPPVASSMTSALYGLTGLPLTARHTVVAGIAFAEANAFIDCFEHFKKLISFMMKGLFHKWSI